MSEVREEDGKIFDDEKIGLEKLNFLLGEEEPEYKVTIKVFGVGGAGGNAVNNMIKAGLTGVEFYHVNTDFSDLKKSLSPNKIAIGKKLTKGWGTGGNKELGEKAALESENELRDAIEGADIIFIAAGLGGGTGTGAAPIIASFASHTEATTIAVVIMPSKFEGISKVKKAEEALKKLKNAAANLLIISNDKLLEEYSSGLDLLEAFRKGDQILIDAVKSISDLITHPGEIHRDFGDLKTVLSRGGRAILGKGRAKGENRAVEAVKMAVNNPIVESASMKEVDKVLLLFSQSIPTGEEVSMASKTIMELTNTECEIFWGTYLEDPNNDELCVTVIASAPFSEEELQLDSSIYRTQKKPSLSFNILDTSPTENVTSEDINAKELGLPLTRGLKSPLYPPTPKEEIDRHIINTNQIYEEAQIPPSFRDTPGFQKKKQV